MKYDRLPYAYFGSLNPQSCVLQRNRIGGGAIFPTSIRAQTTPSPGYTEIIATYRLFMVVLVVPVVEPSRSLLQRTHLYPT